MITLLLPSLTHFISIDAAAIMTTTAPLPGAGQKPPYQSQSSSQRIVPVSQQQPQPPPPQQLHTGLRVPSNRKTIYDRNLNRTRTAELNRATFGYLFAEMVTYAQRRVTGIQDLERRCVHMNT